MDMSKKELSSNKEMYEAMLNALAAEHPELQEEIGSLQDSLFDLSQPDIAGDKEEMMDEEMPAEEGEDEEGAIEIELAMPGKKPIPKELMDEEEKPRFKK